tara:strand:- start:739 stop:1344 length:606 start_codon:yes stop_codon:yes gene_type:complete
MAVATALVIGTVIAAGVSTGVAIDANKKEKAAKGEQQILKDSISDQEKALQKIGNPYANLGVAAKASEFQAEQTDISLANTLDTIRATGGGSGGATALAQAALQSKQGISANIQQQEATNQKMYARGEDTKFARQESRDLMKLDRTQALLDQERQTEMDMRQAKYAAFGNIAGSATTLAGGFASAGSGVSTAGIKGDGIIG